MRRVVSLEADGQRLFGTMHLPPAGVETKSLSLVLLNAGPAPRAGNSDLSTLLASRVAELGVRAFRFDLPGLGDSPGEIPHETIEFWRQVLNGRNDAVTVAMLRKLRVDFGLDRFVLGGLCAGAVTSLCAVDREPASLAGLILLEPNLRMNIAPDFEREQSPARNSSWLRARDSLRKVVSPRHWLYFLTGDNAVARALSPLQPWLRQSLVRVAGNSLPSSTNVEMAMCWARVMSRKTPTLLVTAAGKIDDWYCRRIMDSVPKSSTRAITHIAIPDTNHIFTTGGARERLLHEVTTWILGSLRP